ncbi:MAG: YcaO-like family protein [Deltaproteobacteria bacterium]|nr:YcaO-like family protein [Deltaproteobacteria bacterium]
MQLQYDLRLNTTASGTGYFSCCPVKETDFDKSLNHLRAHPNDEFMHRNALKAIAEMNEGQVMTRIKDSGQNDPLLLALLYEACLLHEKFAKLRECFDLSEAKKLSDHTPFPYIKSSFIDDQTLHFQWTEIFKENIFHHRPLPAPVHAGRPSELFEKENFSAIKKNSVHIRQIHKKMLVKPVGERMFATPSPEETASHALNKLQKINIFADIEMRHIASLSPCALLRQWKLEIFVMNGKHNYSLSGIQTGYGRGLSLNQARASYLMEIVERCSSFADFGSKGTLGYTKDYSLVHARYSELARGNTKALDPNRLVLEAPYKDEPLYWIEGREQRGHELKPILVPVQCVFLFCNLDEIALFSGLGSTGLASGNTEQEAKKAALLETIERDGDGVTPYDPDRCFRIKTKDAQLAMLLADYRAKGIQMQFQDISPSFGVPCYKCFVIGPEGEIIKGTGAHLNGKQAVLSAMTETAYPYPYGPPSSPGPENLPTVYIEDLPDYSTGDAGQDLALLETVLNANGFDPVYINLTRQDLGIPVVKAIVPGLELMADFDRFSRVNPRLYANYLDLFNE